MKKHFSTFQGPLVVAFFAISLSACGGGGAGSPAPGKTSSAPGATPVPTSAARQYQVHKIISFNTGEQFTQTVPGNGNHAPPIPPGGRLRDGGPVAGALITYPDGSVQIADSSGVFLPSASSYAQKNQNKLQTDPNAQPLIVVSDPAGQAKPSTARVAAYVSAPLAVSAMVRSTKSGTLGSIENLAGISLLQPNSSIFSTDSLNLDVQGTDVNNNVVDLSSATIAYPATTPAGGSIVQIPGTTEAYYFPPALGSGSTTDSISVSVSAPNTSTQFTANNTVLVVASSNAVQVSGTMQTSGGTPMPAALALFAQLSKYFPPNYWLASADSSGNYIANVPADQLFNIVVGAPPSFSPTGNLDLFVGSSSADGSDTSYAAGAPGTATLGLFLPPSPIIFTNAGADSLPSFVGFVRDAWYNSVDASQTRIFDAASGIQALLAAVPSAFPSPAAPTPIGSGVFATWCYQWQQPGGVTTLLVAEAEGPNCSQPGNDGYTVSPGPNANAYSYVKYTSNTAYTIASPLDVTTNAMLVKSGTWSQTLTGSPSAITSDTASVQVQLYDAANQVFGSPVYNESLQYQYTLGPGGLSTEHYSNDTRTSAADGSIVAVYDATKTQTAALSSCQGSTASCYAVTGTVQENYDPSSGAFQSNFTIATTLNGDGSQTSTYQSASDGSKVVIPLASNAQQNSSPYCLVCSGNSASVFDVDGVSQLGSFTVNNARLVQFLVLDPTQGGAQVDSLGFIL